MDTALKEKIESLPLGPGVYFMKTQEGDILYIGKAVSLKKRVASYFSKAALYSPKISVLVKKIEDVDVIETPSEVDALLLEAQLINEYTPPYNTRQKDDKSFPLIKISGEKFPLLTITRNKTEKKAKYYGPYTDSYLLREAVKIIHSLFPIRKCKTLPKTPCLYYHLGQCIAPCIKPEVKPEHDRMLQEIQAFLGAGKKSFIDYLTERMEKASREYRYEEAQVFKNQIEALGRLNRKRYYEFKPTAGMGLAATQELKKVLGSEVIPEKIACIDISNIQGKDAVASKVAFFRELPDKNDYRKYHIKSVHGIDDFASIREVVRRMVRGIREGKETFVPDLLLIDGGKGQLSSAYQVLQEEDFLDIKVISIAKRFEHIFTTQTKEPIIFDKSSPALRLLMRIRDEAHRFAISFHRRLREKALSRSFLDDVPGIGEKRKRIILQRFSSSEELIRADLSEIACLPGMNRKIATRILYKLLST